MLTRRIFLRGSAMAMAGAGSVPFWLGRAAATTQGKRKILVVIFQRGAADGLGRSRAKPVSPTSTSSSNTARQRQK